MAETLDKKWQAESLHREEIKAVDRGLKAIDKDKLELEKHFIKNSDIVPFLNNIEAYAVSVGATAMTTALDLSPDKLNLLVTLQAEGSFQALHRFLTLLENSPYELELSSVDILKQSTDVSNNSPWEAHFLIRLLSFNNN